MDELSKEYVISFFDKQLSMYGDRPEAVRWTPGGQILHYECMLEIAGDVEGMKILDYGCGKADLYKFLRDRNIPVRYTGCDINDKLISLARSKYPECDLRVLDIEKDPLIEDFDLVFLCGVFNLKVQGIDDTIKNTLIELFRHCRKGLVFNALSAHNPRKDFELHYINPQDMFDFAVKNLSPFVSFGHDRIPYDFTMFVPSKRTGIQIE